MATDYDSSAASDVYKRQTQDLSGEELNVEVKPRQDDEFTCASCFLVQNQKRLAYTEDDGSKICLDCE